MSCLIIIQWLILIGGKLWWNTLHIFSFFFAFHVSVHTILASVLILWDMSLSQSLRYFPMNICVWGYFTAVIGLAFETYIYLTYRLGMNHPVQVQGCKLFSPTCSRKLFMLKFPVKCTQYSNTFQIVDKKVTLLIPYPHMQVEESMYKLPLNKPDLLSPQGGNSFDLFCDCQWKPQRVEVRSERKRGSHGPGPGESLWHRVRSSEKWIWGWVRFNGWDEQEVGDGP